MIPQVASIQPLWDTPWQEECLASENLPWSITESANAVSRRHERQVSFMCPAPFICGSLGLARRDCVYGHFTGERLAPLLQNHPAARISFFLPMVKIGWSRQAG